MTTLISRKALVVGKSTDLMTVLRKMVWAGILVFSILYSWAGSRASLDYWETPLQEWVYVYLNFPSFVLGALAGALIFLRKPNSSIAFVTSLMLITFTSTGAGYDFWYPIFEMVFSQWPPESYAAYSAALFADVLYMGLLTTSLTFVLLTFPDGRLSSRLVRWFFILLVAIQVLLIMLIAVICAIDVLGRMGGSLSYGIYDMLDKAKAVLLLILAPWPILRLRKITDPVQRQQVKWILAGLAGMVILYAVYTFIPLEAGGVDLWTFFFLLLFTYAFILTLFIAIVRYRLWDMKFIVNKALVYSALTAILGMVGLSGALLLNIFAEEAVKQNPLFGALILVPLAVLFTPVRDGLQALVDKHFKPEEIDISSTIVELAPEAQMMLSSKDILKILVRQSVEQLNITRAAIYLRQPDGQLAPAEPAVLHPHYPQLTLGEADLARLQRGEVAVPPDGSAFSLYIPLLIKRATRPDFLGVLVFGPRISGEGYSTPVLKSLQKLGCDAGKAIYLAQLREHLGQNMVERLAAIERSLSQMNRPIDAGSP